MTRVVAKFGGTSVGSLERIRHAAKLVAAAAAAGDAMCVVVSAMAGETDRLLALSDACGGELGNPETDALLATGEQASAALMALCLRENGLKARSFAAWQIPVMTEGQHGAAAITALAPDALAAAMDEGVIPVVAGYQGVGPGGRTQTLGRGGTDLSAAALAAALDARCDIYTDVDGVYTTDPRIEPAAKRLDAVSHDEMLELAAQGAKVLQARSVEYAKAQGVPMRVLSSFAAPDEANGTAVVEDRALAERRIVSGIAYTRDQSRLAILGASDVGDVARRAFSALARADIGIDMIVQAHSRLPGAGNLEFTLAHRDAARAERLLADAVGDVEIRSETGLAKVSIVGAGLRQRADIARSLFAVLEAGEIAIKLVATSEIRISALINNDAVEQAVRALHAAYGLDEV